jgi:hypothetical protein
MPSFFNPTHKLTLPCIKYSNFCFLSPYSDTSSQGFSFYFSEGKKVTISTASKQVSGSMNCNNKSTAPFELPTI